MPNNSISLGDFWIPLGLGTIYLCVGVVYSSVEDGSSWSPEICPLLPVKVESCQASLLKLGVTVGFNADGLGFSIDHMNANHSKPAKGKSIGAKVKIVVSDLQRNLYVTDFTRGAFVKRSPETLITNNDIDGQLAVGSEIAQDFLSFASMRLPTQAGCLELGDLGFASILKSAIAAAQLIHSTEWLAVIEDVERFIATPMAMDKRGRVDSRLIGIAEQQAWIALGRRVRALDGGSFPTLMACERLVEVDIDLRPPSEFTHYFFNGLVPTVIIRYITSDEGRPMVKMMNRNYLAMADVQYELNVRKAANQLWAAFRKKHKGSNEPVETQAVFYDVVNGILSSIVGGHEGMAKRIRHCLPLWPKNLDGLSSVKLAS